jgi:ribosomal protein S18 acetylase RimI-like enzyme
MQIRPAKASDLSFLTEIDGTIESAEYLHLEQAGEGLATTWKLEPRPLREKLIQSNPLVDETTFLLRQVVSGADEGLVLVAEHDESPVALALAQVNPGRGVMKLMDLRVDYDVRREGVGTVLAYQVIQAARERELRAVWAETRTNNNPANRLLQKLNFQISGIDTRRHSNHDMVKEQATIFWYAALD